MPAERAVLLELTRRAIRTNSYTVALSLRDLATITDTAFSAIKRAVATLAADNKIAYRSGNTTTPSRFLLNFLQTQKIGVPLEPSPGRGQRPYSTHARSPHRRRRHPPAPVRRVCRDRPHRLRYRGPRHRPPAMRQARRPGRSSPLPRRRH